MTDRFYFRQLLAGRDFATQDPIARQMVNFAYLIGDREKGEAVVVDPAYDVDDLVRIAAEDGLRIVGVLGTHWHPDHLGGDLMGNPIAGVRELAGRTDVDARVHVQRAESEWVQRATGVGPGDIVAHDSGDVVTAGDVSITLLHTPGHTPGSQCFLVDGRLVAGDTLFLDGCGRTDLPGADPDAMYDSLHHRLATIPDDTILYPGHLYAPQGSAPLGEVRMHNFVFQVRNLEQWRHLMGYAPPAGR